MEQSDWIADGTVEAEPVTVETPAEIEAESQTVEDVEQPRDEHGKWIAAGAEVAETIEEQTPEEQQIQAFIEGRLGDEPFQIPAGLALPQKRGDDVEYLPIDEVLTRGMRGNDYRVKTTELATQRRQIEREREEFLKDRAKMEARAAYLTEQEKELKEAMTDPQKWAAYQEHLQQYQSNPYYRQNVDRALSAREIEAERDALRSTADDRIVQEASETALGWIESMAENYPSVAPERVAQLYGQALSSGQAQLDPNAVRSIYEAESQYVTRTLSPLQQELADLKATVASLQAQKATETHNETTQHAVNRAKAVPLTTGKGAPVTTPTKPTKFAPSELQDRHQAWINAE
jgi:hypothetical protein